MSSAPENLESYLCGRWLRGEGIETRVVDPVKGDELATVSAKGVDLKGALEFARKQGQGGLRSLSYAERGNLVSAVADVLVANRARYEEIAIANSGNTKADAAIDVDGGIGTLKYYARLGGGLGDARMLLDEKAVRLAKAENYQAIHLDGAAPRRRRPHQCLQFPELGAVGKGGGIAHRRRPGPRQARLRDRAAGACDGEGRHRRQGAARWCAQPPVRRRRRAPRSAHRGRSHRLYRLGRHRRARARPSQRGGKERAGKHRGRQHQCGAACAGFRAWERGLRCLPA